MPKYLTVDDYIGALPASVQKGIDLVFSSDAMVSGVVLCNQCATNEKSNGSIDDLTF